MRRFIEKSRFLLLQSLILLLAKTALLSAFDPVPAEKLYIIHDRASYLTGDTIRLKIINTNRAGGMSQLSSTVYLELVGRGELLVARTKVRMNNATGSTWMAIPTRAKSDYYYLRAYTSWMKNSGPEGFAYSLVSIVNTSMLYPLIPEGQAADLWSSEPESGTLLISCMAKDTIKREFGRREEVQFSFAVTDRNGKPVESNLSASVFFVGNLLQSGDMKSGENDRGSPGSWSPEFRKLSGSGNQSSSMRFHFPELFGPAVSGQVVDKGSGQPAAGKLVTCTSLGSAFQLQVFRTGPDGRFRFVPRDEATYSDLVFEVCCDTIPVEFRFDDPYCDKFPEVALPRWQLNKSQLSFIDLLSIRAQVMDNYNKPEDPGKTVPARERGSFYGLPSETVDMDDYIGLPVMEEVIRELVRAVILYRKGGDLKLGVIDAGSREIIGDHPLFLLDGIPFFEHQVLLGLDPEQIRFIHVVDSKYFVGEMEFDGIIDLRSAQGRAGEIDGFSFVSYRHQGYQPALEKRTSLKDPPDKRKSGDNLPDFRTLLYWNPELSSGAPGRAGFSFTTPDIQGVYRVLVQGLTKEGLKGRCQFDFELRPLDSPL